jgi:hypothetical protein
MARRGSVRIARTKEDVIRPTAERVAKGGVVRLVDRLDSFYEWKRTTAGKQPYAIALADRRLMGMAGLWETWRAGERVRSFTIITTTPNELCAELQDRMPALRIEVLMTPCRSMRASVSSACHGSPARPSTSKSGTRQRRR